MALTKADLANQLFDEVGLNKREAKEFVEMFYEEVRTALEGGRPDRLPATTHHLMPYFLNRYLGGASEEEFFQRFGLDPPPDLCLRIEHGLRRCAIGSVVEENHLGIEKPTVGKRTRSRESFHGDSILVSFELELQPWF